MKNKVLVLSVLSIVFLVALYFYIANKKKSESFLPNHEISTSSEKTEKIAKFEISNQQTQSIRTKDTIPIDNKTLDNIQQPTRNLDRKSNNQVSKTIEQYFAGTIMSKYIESTMYDFISHLSDSQKEKLFEKYAALIDNDHDSSYQKIAQIVTKDYIKKIKLGLQNNLSDNDIESLSKIKQEEVWKKVEDVDISMASSSDEKKKFNDYFQSVNMDAINKNRIITINKYLQTTNMHKFNERVDALVGVDVSRVPEYYYEELSGRYMLYVTSSLNDEEFKQYSEAMFSKPAMIEALIMKLESDEFLTQKLSRVHNSFNL